LRLPRAPGSLGFRMNAEELKSLERFALQCIGNGRGAVGWYQLARILPVQDYPQEDGNSARILKRLMEAGLIVPTNPHQASGKWKYAITEEGRSILEVLGLQGE
jgi:hypothetical protein